MARTRLQLARYSTPIWRRAAFWQALAAVAAAAPLAVAGWLRLAPLQPAPVMPDAPEIDPLLLRDLAREQPTEDALARIVAGNIFAPDRAEWPELAGPEVAEAAAPEADAEKEALAELEALRFVGSIGVGDSWTALFDSKDRTPNDDLIALSVGGAHKSWTVQGISKNSVTLTAGALTRTLDLTPKTTPRKEQAAANSGRMFVDVRPPTSPRSVLIEPPISLDEAKRQLDQRLRDLLGEPSPEMQRRLDELIESVRKDAGDA